MTNAATHIHNHDYDSVEVIRLTRRLCDIPSISNHEENVAEEIASILKKMGLHVARQTVGGKLGRDNLLATVSHEKPEIILTTHIDTVPPFFGTFWQDGWLYGRGVCDAKGIAAAQICALQNLMHEGEGRVGLLFVVGEETDSDGAVAAAQGFVPPVKYFINGEPTDLKLVSAMKGVLNFELSVVGKAAHSAYPHAGKSAIHQLLGDLQRLTQYPWPNSDKYGQTTLNVGLLQGGVAPNVLAPSAMASCVMRTTDDVEGLARQVQGLLDPSTQIRINSRSSPIDLHTIAGMDTCVVAFGSDIPHLAPIGKPLLLGPGSILDAHTSHERVHPDDLQQATQHYQQMAKALLAV